MYLEGEGRGVRAVARGGEGGGLFWFEDGAVGACDLGMCGLLMRVD